jgi:hypothetical protein
MFGTWLLVIGAYLLFDAWCLALICILALVI